MVKLVFNPITSSDIEEMSKQKTTFKITSTLSIKTFVKAIMMLYTQKMGDTMDLTTSIGFYSK